MTAEITEEWAREAPAGEDLDRVCAEWMAPSWKGNDDWWKGFRQHGWGYYSTSWSAAGPLFEAMGQVSHRIADVALEGRESGWVVAMTADRDGNADRWQIWSAQAKSPQLAIARACALLSARGITREEVRHDS